MTGGGEQAARQARAPLRQRSRRRWAAAGGVAACWVVLEVMTGSAVSATVVLVVIAGLGVAGLSGLRALGITRDHPWIQRMASRPWRDGQDVVKVAMRHLPDVFVVTPSGSVPPGRYRLRQGDPVRAGTRPDLIDVQSAHPEFAYAAPQHAYAGP